METTRVVGQAKEGGEGPGARELKKDLLFTSPLRAVAGPRGLRGRRSLCGCEGPWHWMSRVEKSL